MIPLLPRALALVFLGLLCGGAPLPSGAASGPDEPVALEILEEAFGRMFDYHSLKTVTFRIHRQGRVSHRSFHAAYKEIGGRGHTLVRFTGPPYLEGSAMLMIDRSGEASTTWLYRPSDRRARRVSSSQRADSFFGSDFTFEDLEHHDWSTFELRRLPDAVEQGRPCYVVEATPNKPSQYRKMVAHVEKPRLLLLRLDLYQGGGSEPAKTLVLDPDEIEMRDGHAVPQRMWIHQNGRDHATEVVYERTFTDAEIPDRLFKQLRGLGRADRDLAGLVDRLEAQRE